MYSAYTATMGYNLVRNWGTPVLRLYKLLTKSELYLVILKFGTIPMLLKTLNLKWIQYIL